MTRSPGGPGRQPGKPYKDRDAERRRSILSRGGSGSSASGGSGVRPGGSSGASAFDDDDDLDDDFTSTSDRNDSLAARKASPRPGVRPPASKTGGERQVPKAPKEEPKINVNLTYIDPVKRAVAFMIDIIIFFVLSLIISAIVSLLSKLIPPLGMVVTQQGLVVAFLLIKDYFYQGRGIGKNLMGLQVVDVYTGLPPTILQSTKRNVGFYLPLILMWAAQLILRILHLPGDLDAFLLRALELVSFIYVLAVVPAECWLAYNNQDSRRFGDRFAGTGVVEGEMNFTRPF
jgi:RDD family.